MLWHDRTQRNIEVDFILDNRLGQTTGIVLYAGRELVACGDNLWAVPVSVWWAA